MAEKRFAVILVGIVSGYTRMFTLTNSVLAAETQLLSSSSIEPQTYLTDYRRMRPTELLLMLPYAPCHCL